MAKENILIRSKKKKGLALVQDQRYAEARSLYSQLSTQAQRDPEVWFMLGAVNGKLARYDEALHCLDTALAIDPQHALVQFNRGVVLRDLGQLDAAADAFAAALEYRPQALECAESLAQTALALGRMDLAVSAMRTGLRHHPHKSELHYNLGGALQALGRHSEAVECYREALRRKPGLGIAYDNLGSTLCAQGKFDEAVACYRDGLARNPADSRTRSNLLLTLNYLPDIDSQRLLEEHREWGRLHGQPAGRWQRHDTTPEPERRLRVGYVSSDFRMHSVAYFFEPLLEHHDPASIEAICYSAVLRPDATTGRLRAHAAEWRDVTGLDDAQVAQLIHDDGVDILVDLAGHTAGSHLRVFAYRPAPVQITYLGYPATTGLPVIDYRITDIEADPPAHDPHYCEDLLRVPGCFVCYRPPDDCPEVAPLPAQSNGFVTFGSFNNLSKINHNVIRLWSRLLRDVPSSRLFIKNPSLTDEPTRDEYRRLFEAQGIAPERLTLRGHTPTPRAHLELYGEVDVALDTFPYNGTTTTCEALWMGVPVVTLTGRQHAGRVGTSLLRALDLPQCIAEDEVAYVARAAALAGDTGRLSALRGALRERMRGSALCDARGFAQRVEQVYRDVWGAYCRRRVASS